MGVSMKLSLKILLIISLLFASSASANIYSLIKEGKIAEATDSLNPFLSAATRNGDILFFQSLLEPSAKKSADLMEASLKASVSLTYRQEIYYLLAQYYLFNGEYSRLATMISEYRSIWPQGKYAGDMSRYSILIDEHNRSYEVAYKQAERIIGSSDEKHWSQIDQVRILLAQNQKTKATEILRKLSKESDSVGEALALYLLAGRAIELKRPDDAVFFYNMLREAYPSAVGLDALINKMSLLTATSDTDSRAEKLTGTYYSVQVGVFSSKENANNMADKFKKYDKKIEIRDKTVSDKKYQVVYIGHFTTLEDAYTFKNQIEHAFDEVFQVVAR